MPEELGEGLDLALVGMGLVFITLVIFMLILFALRSLFPGEEIVEDVQGVDTEEDPVAAAIMEMEAHEDPAIEEHSHSALQEHTATRDASTDGSIPGYKVATIAVALYLAMQQEADATPIPVLPSTWTPSQDPSGWSILGRSSLWGSQGHRPQAYSQRSQSAYPPRNRFGK
jgi:hypothetical protein